MIFKTFAESLAVNNQYLPNRLICIIGLSLRGFKMPNSASKVKNMGHTNEIDILGKHVYFKCI